MTYRHIEPMMSDSDRAQAAYRLIRAAGFDPESGDTEVVSDMGIGYANGESYSGMSDVWVAGNWNDKTDYSSGERVVVDSMPGRLFDALERIGVNGEWSDEWDTCSDCLKLIRTEPDSYAWTPQYILSDDGEFVCVDCIKTDAASWVDDHYANEVDRALTWLSAIELTELGWRDAFPDDYDTQTGFHPGQNGSPAAMVKQLDASNDGRDWVFLITDKGQFDVSYRLFVRDDDVKDDQ